MKVWICVNKILFDFNTSLKTITLLELPMQISAENNKDIRSVNLIAIATIFVLGLSTFGLTFSEAFAETIILRSGNGVLPGTDTEITFLEGPANDPFDAAFSPQNFTDASNGPSAFIINGSDFFGWGNLDGDPIANWTATKSSNNANYNTGLYAINFTITSGSISMATLDFNYRVNKDLGDPINEGLFINGMPLANSNTSNSGPFTGTDQSFPTFDITSLVNPGLNILYINAADDEPANVDKQAGLLFNATINVTSQQDPINVNKTWTHTDYNWDPICTFFNETSQMCEATRPANINNATDDVLAEPLPLDVNGTYLLNANVKSKNNQFQNTNPGAFYALTTVNVTENITNMTVWENYEDCTDTQGLIQLHNSKKLSRSVKIAIADIDGNVTEITDNIYDGIGGNITSINSTSAHIELTDPISAGSTVYVLVKFQNDLKGFDTGNGEFDEMCDNSEEVVATIDQDSTVKVANASLRITNQE